MSAFIVAVRVEDVQEHALSSKMVKCSRCGKDCWVQQSQAWQPEDEIVCVQCVGPAVGERISVVRAAAGR